MDLAAFAEPLGEREQSDDPAGLGAAVESACRTAGCFNIIDSGIDSALTAELLERMETFFSLPDMSPIKQAAHRSRNKGANGWTPLLEEPAYEAGTIAWVESFDCVLSRERLTRLPAAIGNGIQPGIWPLLPGFRDIARRHWDALMEAGGRLYPVFSRLLRQDDDFLSRHAGSQALNTMRLLNYPKNHAVSDAVNKGISAHTDFECITLIHQTAPGLEVQGPAGEWRQAPAEPGQWTVLLGDMIERWSNGAYKATPHRVPVTPWPRRSIVMFLAADPGLEIRPLEAFVSLEIPPRFEPVTQDSLIKSAMTRAEANRQAMLQQVERIRKELSPG